MADLHNILTTIENMSCRKGQTILYICNFNIRFVVTQDTFIECKIFWIAAVHI